MGYYFHSKRVLANFLLTFLAMFILPLSTFYSIEFLLNTTTHMSHSTVSASAGISSVISIWVIMGIYTYTVIKDPNNFTYE